MIALQPYQVGGSLQDGASTYVPRQADDELYSGLRSGQFCYVLNSRQMGKSSLRVRTMARLRSQGYVCLAFEMRELCLCGVSADEFYGGFVSHLAGELGLEIDLSAWWMQHQLLHPFLRLNKFVEEVVLESITGSIVIFIDEIDTILNLEFKDDFFAFVRACYHRRSDKPQFQRLTFALFGVATPVDLIADQSLTQMNLESRAIELTGFTLEEAKPLETGLARHCDQPTAVMSEILNWTGGQPLLTQWVCHVLGTSGEWIVAGREAQQVELQVRSQIIDAWLTHDRQQHFQTIRDRILNHPELACWALGLYQQLLQQGEVSIEDSPELMQFRLSGLVVKRHHTVFIYNRIYRSIFDQSWTEQSLRQIRPYGPEFAAWEASRRQPDYLLSGDRLQAALDWAEGLSLSQIDYQYLSASQTYQLQIAQTKTDRALTQEQQALQRLTQVQRKTKQRTIIGSIFLLLSATGTIATYSFFQQSNQVLQTRSDLQALDQDAARLLQTRSDATQIPDLLTALKSATALQALMQEQKANLPPTYAPIFALQEILKTIQHKNSWKVGLATQNFAFSPNSQSIVTADTEGLIKLWSVTGKLLTQIDLNALPLPGNENASQILKSPIAVLHTVFHPFKRQLGILTLDGSVYLLDLHQKIFIRYFKPNLKQRLRRIQFNVTGTEIMGVSQRGELTIFDLQGRVIRSQQILDRALQSEFVNFFMFTDDRQSIVYLNGKSNPEVHEIKTGKISARYPKITLPSDQLMRHQFYSPDRSYLSTDFGTLNLWNAQGQLLSSIVASRRSITDFAYSPDRSRFALLSGDQLHLWTPDSEQLLTTSFKRSAVGYSDRPSDFYQGPNAPISLWQSSYPTTPERVVPPEAKNANLRITQVERHPTQNWMIRLHRDGRLVVQDLQGRSLQQIRSGLQDARLQISPNGQLIVLVSKAQKQVQIRNLEGGLIKTLAIPSDWDFFEMSPDGQMFAIGGEAYGTVFVYDLDGKLKHKFNDVQGVKFRSPDTLITVPTPESNDRRVSLWSLSEQRSLKVLFERKYKDSWVHIYRNGYFAEIGSDQSLILYRPDGQSIESLKTGTYFSEFPESHNGEFFAIVAEDNLSRTSQRLDSESHRHTTRR